MLHMIRATFRCRVRVRVRVCERLQRKLFGCQKSDPTPLQSNAFGHVGTAANTTSEQMATAISKADFGCRCAGEVSENNMTVFQRVANSVRVVQASGACFQENAKQNTRTLTLLQLQAQSPSSRPQGLMCAMIRDTKECTATGSERLLICGRVAVKILVVASLAVPSAVLTDARVIVLVHAHWSAHSCELQRLQ
jgi:hypothetical protein